MNGTSWLRIGAAALLGLVPVTGALYVNNRMVRKGPGKGAIYGGLVYGALAVVSTIGAVALLGTGGTSGLPRGAYFEKGRYLPNVGDLYLPRHGGLPVEIGYLDVNRSKVGLLDVSRRVAGLI